MESFLSSAAEFPSSIGAPGYFCRLQREEAAIRHSGAQLFSEEVAQGSNTGLKGARLRQRLGSKVTESNGDESVHGLPAGKKNKKNKITVA